MAVFVRIVHRAGATAEYNNGSDELLHGTTSSEGPARSTAELAVVGVVVGTKAHLSPAGSAAATSEIVLDVGTCEVMNNRQCVIWRYDSPAVDVLDADEAELICAAQIADCLSLPARVVAPPWMRHLGWGRAVSRGGRLRARGHQSSKSAAD